MPTFSQRKLEPMVFLDPPILDPATVEIMTDRRNRKLAAEAASVDADKPIQSISSRFNGWFFKPRKGRA